MCFIMYACAHLSCIILGFVVSNKIPLYPHYLVVCFNYSSLHLFCDAQLSSGTIAIYESMKRSSACPIDEQ